MIMNLVIAATLTRAVIKYAKIIFGYSTILKLLSDRVGRREKNENDNKRFNAI